MLLHEDEPLIESRSEPRKSKYTPNTRLTRRAKVSLCLLISLFIVIGIVVAISPRNNKGVEEWVHLETIDAQHISSDWKLHSSVDKDHTIKLTFAVKQSNTEKLHEKLLSVSDPKSSDFGKHLSYKQVHSFLSPSTKSKATVRDWLLNHGVRKNEMKQVTPNGDFIEVEMNANRANKLLNTEFSNWEHTTSGKKHIRVKDEYFVPKSLAQHLDFISPTLRFPFISHTKESSKLIAFDTETISEESSSYVTPAVLKELYNINQKGGKSDSNYQAVASFLSEWFDDDDLHQFWDYFSVDQTQVTRIPETQSSGYGTEAELDVQYITATGEGVNTLVWDIEDDMYFISLLKQISKKEYPTPSVVSMSYGGDEPSVGYSYSMRANVEFAKVGLMGVTFFASSGDAGVLSSSETCNNGAYVPTFPASSPYVTAVGGTTGGFSGSNNNKEKAWSYSGGGFSGFFDQNDFQTNVISNYLNNNNKLPDSSKYVSTGAGYPDLSAQSSDFVVCSSGNYWLVSGTSASCPTVAGMIAVINDARLANGKSALGWLNPTIYGIYNDGLYSEYFNDITDGYNEGCNNGKGFYTDEGWDPVTGLGTIKFDKLYDYLVDL